jgi:large subunit ribosomal protein L6
MSRIGKQPITIPQGVEVKVSKTGIEAKGPKGTRTETLMDGVLLKQEEQSLILSIEKKTQEASVAWGTSRALIANLITGVSTGFEKRLEIHGVGYKARLQGKKLVLDLGFSHPVEFDTPDGIEVKIEKNVIIISGIDKQAIGLFAAKIRECKPPEPYKGKGIRYVDEYVIRKEGKRAGTESE